MRKLPILLVVLLGIMKKRRIGMIGIIRMIGLICCPLIKKSGIIGDFGENITIN
jgi:hypothetical protein